MNHCSVRFICSNYSDRIECDYYKKNVDCLREIHCEHEFNGECINKDAQKQALKERQQ